MRHSDCVLAFFFPTEIVAHNRIDRELSGIAHSTPDLGQKIVDLKGDWLVCHNGTKYVFLYFVSWGHNYSPPPLQINET